MKGSSPIRLLPVLMLLIGVLLMFKLAVHLFDRDSSTGTAVAQETQETQETEQKVEEPAEQPAEEEVLDPEVTGELTETAPADEKSDVPVEISAAEREVLESLLDRRKQLDEREKQLQLREKLLLAAEKRVEERIGELKTIEARIEASFGKQEEERKAQMQNVVSMYENMKPKRAARIFDKLEMSVLIDVVKQMKTRKMAPILANMDAKVAQRLTVELARIAAEQPVQ